MRIEAINRARLWRTDPVFDAETRKAAAAISENPEQLMACFGQELSFGTGGLRGVLGVGSNRMNRYTVARATQGLAAYLQATGGQSVAIAYDTRIGSREFAGIVAGVLAHSNISSWLFDAPAPTPMLSFAVRTLRCDAGVVITASHNPAQYNGYKVYGPDGCQIVEEAAAAITAHIEKVKYGALAWMPEEDARRAGLLSSVPSAVLSAYAEKTLACRVWLSETPPRLKLAYTPLHGVGLEAVRAATARMPGIEFIEVSEQCVQDGNFSTCPAPNPERREALALALDYARRENADLILATDPGCDRVGVAVRGAEGDYRALTGDEIGLLLMEHILVNRPASAKAPVVIKTIVSSDLAFDIAKAHGGQVLEVLTGFKYIGEAIGRMEAAGELDRFAFAFEESCGYLAGVHVRDKDGVMASMLVAEMAQYHAASGKNLAQALDALYKTYGYMGTRLVNFTIAGALPMPVMRTIMARLRADPPATLAGLPVTRIKDYDAGVDGLPRSDVLSMENDAGTKVILRPSGTEPKLKAYLSAKGQSSRESMHILDSVSKQVEEWIGQLAD